MADNKKLHEFAKQVYRAQGFDQVNRANTISEVMKEARYFGIDPNQVLTYVQNNEEALKKETGFEPGKLIDSR